MDETNWTEVGPDVLSYTPAADLPDGEHTLYVQSRLTSEGAWSASGSFTVEVDTTAPAAVGSLAYSPLEQMHYDAYYEYEMAVTDLRPRFSWTLTEPAASLSIALTASGDSDVFIEIPGTQTSWAPEEDLVLPDYLWYYSFSIRARDAAGNESTVSQISDMAIGRTTPTTLSITSPTNDPTPTWTITHSDPALGAYNKWGHYYQLDSDEGSPLNDWTFESSETYSYTPAIALAEGTHTLYAASYVYKGESMLSPVGSGTVTIDLTVPAAPSIEAVGRTSDKRPIWYFDGPADLWIYRVQMDSEAGAWTELAQGLDSWTPSSDLADASYTLYVQARDEAGNWSASSSATVIVDSNVPVPPDRPVVDDSFYVYALTESRYETSQLVNLPVSGTGAVPNEPVTLYQSANDIDYTQVATGTADASGAWSLLVPEDISGYPYYYLHVTTTSTTGLESDPSLSTRVDLDTTAEYAPIVTGPEQAPWTYNKRPAFTIQSGISGYKTLRWQIDGTDEASWTEIIIDPVETPARTYTFRPAAALSTGSHTLYAQAADRVGNWAETTFAFSVETPQVNPQLVSVSAGSFNAGNEYWDPTKTISSNRVYFPLYESAFSLAENETTTADFVTFLNEKAAELSISGDHVSYQGQYILTLNASDSLSTVEEDSGYFMPVAGKDLHPVNNVSWYGAAAFCNWLSENEGLDPVYTESGIWPEDGTRNGYRLPSEFEWEYAASGAAFTGNKTSYPWGDAAPSSSLANIQGSGPVAVTSYPSVNGLYDMGGNLMELTGTMHYDYAVFLGQGESGESTASAPINLTMPAVEFATSIAATNDMEFLLMPYADTNVGWLDYDSQYISQYGSFPGSEYGIHLRQDIFISSFYAAKYEITNTQYAEFLNDIVTDPDFSWYDANRYALYGGAYIYHLEGVNSTRGIAWDGTDFAARAGYEDYPVTRVTFVGAARFANWLSVNEGLSPAYTFDVNGLVSDVDIHASGYRLPTSFEWEYAVAHAHDGQGGRTIGNKYMYPWGNFGTKDRDGVTVPNYTTITAVGASGPYNGLYDTGGNVSEMCSDRGADLGTDVQEGDRDPAGSSNTSILEWRVRGTPADTNHWAYGNQSIDSMTGTTTTVFDDNTGFRLIKPVRLSE